MKRVFAWILLVGFVLLLLNIMIFHIYIVPSITLYMVIALWFIFSSKPYAGKRNRIVPEKPEEETGIQKEKNEEN